MLHTLFIRESLETMGVTTPTQRFWRGSRMKFIVTRRPRRRCGSCSSDACRSRAGRSAQAAAALGVSVRTVAKWLARARRRRSPDRSSRPHRQPRRRAGRAKRRSWRCAGRAPRPGRSARALGVPRSTVTRVLGARRPESRGRCSSRRPSVQRYEWPHVGDLLHLDLKRLGRVVGIGHRIHGDRRRRRARGRLGISPCRDR